jgi:hypothetical protein
MGAGVISFIDSVVLDTMIRGQHKRTIILTIKHYGAQIFSDRDFIFTELYLVQQNALTFSAEIRFNIDRDVLVQIGNLTSVGVTDNREGANIRPIRVNRDYLFLSKPEGTGNWVRLMIVYEKPVSIQFSMLWNASSNTYTTILISQIDFYNPDIIHKALNDSPVRVSRKKLFFEQADIWFLKGNASVVMGEGSTRGMVQTADNEFYEFPLSGQNFEFSIPVFSKSKKMSVQFGLGDGKETAIKHHLLINGKALDKIKSKEKNTEKTANIIFFRNH